NRLSLPVWLSVHIVIEILEALAFAHDLRNNQGRRRNLVHCDVTPENVFLSTGGEVKLGDFGVAHDDTRAEDEFPGEVRGKLAYMAPEQLSGRPVDQRTDVFSVGVILWEALTQRRLFRAKSDSETVSRICKEDRPRPSLYNKKIPPRLDDAVLAAVCADRTRRTRTARELQRTLTDIQAELGHRVALVDVERALRKILKTDSTQDIDTTSCRTPTADSSPSPKDDINVDIVWPTLPPRSDPLGTLSAPDLLKRPGERLPPFVPPRKSAPRPVSRPLSPPNRAANDSILPVSQTAGWTAALTGTEPPRLPPGFDPMKEPTPLPVEPSPHFVAPICGSPSQVETADILKWPKPPMVTDPLTPTADIPRAPMPSSMRVVVGTPPSGAPGFWLRRPGGATTGPRPVTDALTVLRRLLLDSPLLDAEVSADGKTWHPGTLFARLLGEEVVCTDDELPDTPIRGSLAETSITALFGRIARSRSSGRLILVLERPGRPERYELHVYLGRLLHVASSRSLFAAWRTLLCSPQIEQQQLRTWITRVVESTQPFELVAAAPAVEAVRAQQAHFAQVDLQTLFSERAGRSGWVCSSAQRVSTPFPDG
ncbi:MAG: protein kinase, partial [Myxococcota bacterium]